jgi:signal transduction histidine kinase
MKTRRTNPLYLFYILFAYVLLQFGWWSYLMVNLNNENYQLKTEENILKGESPEEVSRKGNELEKKLHLRWAMIAGEGSVFIVLLLLGIVQTRSAFKKETALTQQQKNFLLSVTHELKSPIASVKLQLETLQKRELEKNMQKEILGSALADTERLDKLVENILMATRIDNSAYVLHREPTDLSGFISTGMKQTLAAFNPKQRVVLDIEPGIHLGIDRTSFPSILLNLFENAVKYSPANSAITVSLKKQGSRIHLLVKDEGTGISDAEKPDVFRKFYRSGNEETRRTKGTGLGLYIVKYLVEQHGGSIAVKNNVPQGSIFEITFGATALDKP